MDAMRVDERVRVLVEERVQESVQLLAQPKAVVLVLQWADEKDWL